MTVLSLLLLSLPLASCAAIRAVAENFSLYGYGQGSEGLELFFSNGYAFLGNVTNTTTIDAEKVFFSESPSDTSVWTVTPAIDNSTWTEKLYYIPSASATDRRTGFIDSDATASATQVTDNFGFYGKTAFHSTDAGAMETHWYATMVSAEEAIFSLRWRNDTDYPEASIPITLRSWAPPPPLMLE